jgi:hypothetical protein
VSTEFFFLLLLYGRDGGETDRRRTRLSIPYLISTEIYKIRGSYSKDSDVGLLRCNSMWTCRHVTIFWRNMPSPFSALNQQTHSMTTRKTNINFTAITVFTNKYVSHKPKQLSAIKNCPHSVFSLV